VIRKTVTDLAYLLML